MTQPWTALFEMNRAFMMDLNLDDISQAMADRVPAEGLHSISWTLAHVVQYRRQLLEALPHAPFRPALAEPRSLGELRVAVDEVQAALAEAFDAVQDWSALRPHPAVGEPMPLAQIAGSYLSHDAYHLGQLGAARRLLGLPGALKLPEEAACV